MKGEKYSLEYLPTQPSESSQIRKHAEELLHKYSDPSFRTEKTHFIQIMQNLTNEIVGIEPKKTDKVSKLKKVENNRENSEKLFIPSGLRLPSTESLKNFRSLREKLRSELGYTHEPSNDHHEVEDEHEVEDDRSTNASILTSPSIIENDENEDMEENSQRRPIPDEKWFYPKIHSNYNHTSSASTCCSKSTTTTIERDDESGNISSAKPLPPPPPPPGIKVLEEKECQTFEDDLPQLPSNPIESTKPQFSPHSMSNHEDQDNDYDHDPIIPQHHETHHPLPSQTSIPPTTRPLTDSKHVPYNYNEKWLRPTLYSHSPPSSIVSIPPPELEKENQSIQSSLSSHSNHSEKPKEKSSSKSFQKYAPTPSHVAPPPPPLSSRHHHHYPPPPQQQQHQQQHRHHHRPNPVGDIIHVDAPHTHLIFTPHEINVQRKTTNSTLSQPFTPIHLDSHSHSHHKRPTHNPTKPLPSSLPNPEKRSDYLSSRIHKKPVDGHANHSAAVAAPSSSSFSSLDETLDLSKLSFEMIQHLHVPKSSSYSSSSHSYQRR